MNTITNSKKRIFVCGAGHQGFSMAAHLTLEGNTVHLWNRTQANIQEVIDTGVIHCNGVVNGDARIAKVTSNMQEAVSDFVMVVTPSSAHKDIAKEILDKGIVVVKNEDIALAPEKLKDLA